MSEKPRTAVFVGRFQPYHNGHKAIVDQALNDFDYVVVVIGSAHQPRTKKNPWTWNERVDMITAAHPLDEDRLFVTSVRDNPESDDDWAKSVAGIAQALAPPASEMFLVGHRKDESSFYLDLFPDWELVEYDSHGFKSGTDIRSIYFNTEGSFESKIEHDVPVTTLARLQQFIDMRTLEELRREK